jgi:hypothetical protein
VATIEVELVVSEIVAAEPVIIDPVAVEPVAVEPVAVELAAVEPGITPETAESATLARVEVGTPAIVVVAGLSFEKSGNAESANETPTPPTSTATTVAAIVMDFLLMFCNRLMKFSFEHLEHLLPLQEQPQRNARGL